MTEPKLKPLTNLRVKLVDSLARWLHVPIEIVKHDLYEVKAEYVRLYIEDCLTIGEQVFEMADHELAEMSNRLTKFHMDHMDNPFNLHDGPFNRVCSWHGITVGDDRRIFYFYWKYQQAADAGMKLNSLG